MGLFQIWSYELDIDVDRYKIYEINNSICGPIITQCITWCLKRSWQENHRVFNEGFRFKHILKLFRQSDIWHKSQKKNTPINAKLYISAEKMSGSFLIGKGSATNPVL